MFVLKKLFVIVLLFLFNHESIAQLSDNRQNQLDSLVTNIDRKILKNLDSVHAYIHHLGDSDEERVFMFYGLFAIHFKYDMKRYWQRDSKAELYSNYYTAYKRSGVCRDFAALFKELCDRSSIPCLVVNGKTKHGKFLMAVKKFVTLNFREPNHAWNIVKYNNTWHHMDPTWSKIERVEKYYEVQEEGELFYVAKAKIPNRTYYDISYEDLYAQRKAIHPAFLANDTVFTYKTIKRKYKNRRVYKVNYPFEDQLLNFLTDTIYEKKLQNSRLASVYSGYGTGVYDLEAGFKFLEIKRTKYNPITLEDCDNNLRELEKQLKDTHSKESEIWARFYDHQLKIYRYKEKIRRKNWKETFE